jgi:beta-N-acetylhexosaminidase
MREILRQDMKFRGVIFSDDIGMAAATSAGGVAARIDAHLDAGCDVVLVCAPSLVADSLKAMDRRSPLNSTALTELMAKQTRGWDGLRAEARYDGVRTALSGPDFPVI